MDLGIAGRTAVVCASTSGLGEAIARALAAEGAHVVVSGRRGERARQIADELPSAVGVEVDLKEPGDDERLLATALEAFGEIDILVLNGPGPVPRPAAEVTEPDVDGAIDTLLRPHVRLVRAVLPGMRQPGLGSDPGRRFQWDQRPAAQPRPVQPRARRAGRLPQDSRRRGRRGRRDGEPAAARPDRDGPGDGSRPGSCRSQRAPVDDIEEEAIAQIPAGRYGEPAEFGGVAAFLCSRPASYVMGTAVRCDGGLLGSL